MVAIWARTLLEEKLIHNSLYKKNEAFDLEKFDSYLIEICYELDIPTPVVLKTHLYNFSTFNTVKFKASDFVEPVSFEYLVLENAEGRS